MNPRRTRWARRNSRGIARCAPAPHGCGYRTATRNYDPTTGLCDHCATAKETTR